MDIKKVLKCSYEWAKIPTDLNKSNLVLVTAKTSKPTIHPEDTDYPIRIFPIEELRERAATLAQRPVGLNHLNLIELSAIEEELTGSKYAFTVDAQWNENEEAIEALLYLPNLYMDKIKNGDIDKVSVEYIWRDEVRTEKGVEFKGIIFNRVDLLEGINPGDKDTGKFKLIEGKRGLMEGKISMEESIPKELSEAAISFLKTLGEPFAGYKDFADCVAKNKDKSNPDAYCGYIKHKVEDPKKETILQEAKEEKVEEEPKKDISPEKEKPLKDVPAEKDKKPKEDIPDKEETKDTIPPVQNKLKPVEPEPVTDNKSTVVPEPTTSEPVVTSSSTTEKPTEPLEEPVTNKPKAVEPEPTVEPVQANLELKPAVEQPERIAELEKAVNKLQETVKKADAEKNKAVEEAKRKLKKELLDKVESTLPSSHIVSSFNLGGQRLARDIRRVLYKEKEE